MTSRADFMEHMMYPTAEGAAGPRAFATMSSRRARGLVRGDCRAQPGDAQMRNVVVYEFLARWRCRAAGRLQEQAFARCACARRNAWRLALTTRVRRRRAVGPCA